MQETWVQSLGQEDPLKKEMAIHSNILTWETLWIEEPGGLQSMASLSITDSQSSLKLMSIESVMSSSHLIFCCPLLLPPPILPSIRVFSNESTLHEVAKVLEFQLQHKSFQWTPRTDLFKMDWLDLLVIQGTPKSLIQHHSSKASVLWCSSRQAFRTSSML